MAETTVTPDNDSTAQAGAEGSATTPTAPSGTGSVSGATWESRFAGLEARLSEQGRAKAEAERQRDEALKRASDLESGKVSAEDALQAQLRAEQAKTAAAEQKVALAELKGRFPEAYEVFGEGIANLTPEALAAAEARFTGAAPAAEPPTPRNPSAQRPAAAQIGEARDGVAPTLAQLRAQAPRPNWLDE